MEQSYIKVIDLVDAECPQCGVHGAMPITDDSEFAHDVDEEVVY